MTRAAESLKPYHALVKHMKQVKVEAVTEYLALESKKLWKRAKKKHILLKSNSATIIQVLHFDSLNMKAY